MLVRPPSVQDVGVIAVSVPKAMATGGGGFSFLLPAQIRAEAPPNASVKVSMPDGAPLPMWLTYVAETNSFVASAVPDGAFPVQVVVTVGSRGTTVVISERTD